MSQLFHYKGKYYGSIPMLPIKIGSKVFIVFKTVGLIHEGMQYLKRVGEVTHIFYPHSSEHDWWSIPHTLDYVVPEQNDIIIKVYLGGGISDIFLTKDMINVAWIPTDSLPTIEDAVMFNLL